MLFVLVSTVLLTAAAARAQSTHTSSAKVSTISPSVIVLTAVSSALATATAAPVLVNPADISNYPICAQICNNETIGVVQQIGSNFSAPSNLEGLCGVEFRSLTAGCEAVTCSANDIQQTMLLAKQLCGNLYEANATLSSSVSAAVASATSAALAATQGKDVTDISNYPQCVQTCFPPHNYNGCGNLANLECVCQGTAFNNAVIPCEKDTCSVPDLTTLFYLSQKLCQPVGGVLTHPTNSTSISNTTTGSSTPSPSPFTGGGSRPRISDVAAMIISLAAITAGLLML